MENKNIVDVPDHLKVLMQPTPSGVEKLLCAWDCLSGETQILILSNLEGIAAPPYLTKKIRIKALDSNNAYVRYLAARKLYFESDCTNQEQQLRDRIENDPAPLVKYSLMEGSLGWTFFSSKIEDADLFFSQPQEARLAQLRLVSGIGESLAGLISQATEKHLKDGSVSETEIYEILSDYLMSPEFQKEYTDKRVTYDGMGEHLKGKDIDSLWHLVTKLPISISFLLIDRLPEKSGLGSGIPQNVIEAMTDSQLARLLYREDIKLEKLRHELFWGAAKERRTVIYAAANSNFDIKYSEFYLILKKPPADRVQVLVNLGLLAYRLSLCLYEAIHDCLVVSDASLFDFQDAIYPRDRFEIRIHELQGWKREKQLTELRLYREAKKAVPWDSKREGYPPYGELEFLSKVIVPGDTWLTFMEFSKAWAKNPFWSKKAEKYLPRIYEVGEEDWDSQDTETDLPPDESSELIKSIDGKLTALQQIIQSSDDHEGQELLEGLGQIREHTAELSTQTYNQAQKFKIELKNIEDSITRQSFLLYSVIGLVIWLLIMKF